MNFVRVVNRIVTLENYKSFVYLHKFRTIGIVFTPAHVYQQNSQTYFLISLLSECPWLCQIPIAPSDRDPSKVIKQFNSLSKILDRWKNAEYEYMPQCSKKWENSKFGYSIIVRVVALLLKG